MAQILIYVCLFLSATVYALLLSTPQGKLWADEQTWVTVAIGVALVGAWMGVEDPALFEKVFVYFSIAGFPIVIRSLWLQLQRIERTYKREMK